MGGGEKNSSSVSLSMSGGTQRYANGKAKTKKNKSLDKWKRALLRAMSLQGVMAVFMVVVVVVVFSLWVLSPFFLPSPEDELRPRPRNARSLQNRWWWESSLWDGHDVPTDFLESEAAAAAAFVSKSSSFVDPLETYSYFAKNGLAEGDPNISLQRACQSTEQGPHLVADDKGLVCTHDFLDTEMIGCCMDPQEALDFAILLDIPVPDDPLVPDQGSLFAPSERWSCPRCNSDIHCCRHFEQCVSCCQDPALVCLSSSFLSLS